MNAKPTPKKVWPKKKGNHRATGKPHGGARLGAGRPRGSKNILPKGAILALKSCRLRVPKDTDPALAELADRALQRVADVMDEKVHFSVAAPVLKAATTIREEICGPITRKVEIEGKIGLSAILDEMEKLPDGHEEVVAHSAAEAVIEAEVVEPVVAKGPIIRRKGSTVQ